jgi:3-methyladenine DNA glycosylase/8-oxoguanine DNA glycosylase
VIAELQKRHRGRRLTKTGSLVPVLVAAILEQKVTGIEARRAWRRLTRATSEPAPGPRRDLLLPPDPARVAALGAYAFHPFGVEERRAMTVKRVCANADRIERLGKLALEDAKQRLGEVPGIGPWTVAEVARLGLGDPDAVSIGDYHLPHLVAWALAGEARATDERMLELLEPYEGQRGRVQLLLEAGHISAPRFGPRREPAAIERL